MWRMLRKKGFKLYLINEIKTSILCPKCNFSPLPYQRTKILQKLIFLSLQIGVQTKIV
ncbi:hypothetical protein BDF14DRAFT_1803350 [Spinellus fusiger]|nr:hypothetical protein BDF14DRAFT_1803350 [Spinellus fusiger]